MEDSTKYQLSLIFTVFKRISAVLIKYLIGLVFNRFECKRYPQQNIRHLIGYKFIFGIFRVNKLSLSLYHCILSISNIDPIFVLNQKYMFKDVFSCLFK